MIDSEKTLLNGARASISTPTRVLQKYPQKRFGMGENAFIPFMGAGINTIRFNAGGQQGEENFPWKAEIKITCSVSAFK